MADGGKGVDSNAFLCDLCQKTVSWTALVHMPIGDVQQAVRDGFNPFQTSSINMPAPESLSSEETPSVEQQFALWRERVMGDATVDHWYVCPDCARALLQGGRADRVVEAEPAEGWVHDIAKAGKLFISPAGALLVLICFFLPWVKVTCVGSEFSYSAADGELGGILWLGFVAAIGIISLSVLGIWWKKSEGEDVARWPERRWFVGLVITAIAVVSGGLVVGLGWVMGPPGAWLGAGVLVVLMAVYIIWAKLKITAQSLIAISAVVGLLALFIRYFQAINASYYLGPLGPLKYEDVKHLIDVQPLYGAWLAVAGFIIAYVGALYLFLRPGDEETMAVVRPPAKKEPKPKKETKKKEPKEKKEEKKKKKTWWDWEGG